MTPFSIIHMDVQHICIAGAPQNAVLLSPSFPGSPPETKPEDGKAYQELKGMLSSSMEARDQANTERKVCVCVLFVPLLLLGRYFRSL